MTFGRRHGLPSDRAATLATKVSHLQARSAGNKVTWEHLERWFTADGWTVPEAEQADSPEDMERMFSKVEAKNAAVDKAKKPRRPKAK